MLRRMPDDLVCVSFFPLYWMFRWRISKPLRAALTWHENRCRVSLMRDFRATPRCPADGEARDAGAAHRGRLAPAEQFTRRRARRVPRVAGDRGLRRGGRCRARHASERVGCGGRPRQRRAPARSDRDGHRGPRNVGCAPAQRGGSRYARHHRRARDRARARGAPEGIGPGWPRCPRSRGLKGSAHR